MFLKKTPTFQATQINIGKVQFRQITSFVVYSAVGVSATGYTQITYNSNPTLRCATACTRDSNCSLFIVQSNACFLHTLFITFNFLMANAYTSSSVIWQKGSNG
jgi:hypothetical protein